MAGRLLENRLIRQQLRGSMHHGESSDPAMGSLDPRRPPDLAEVGAETCMRFRRGWVRGALGGEAVAGLGVPSGVAMGPLCQDRGVVMWTGADRPDRADQEQGREQGRPDPASQQLSARCRPPHRRYHHHVHSECVPRSAQSIRPCSQTERASIDRYFKVSGLVRKGNQTSSAFSTFRPPAGLGKGLAHRPEDGCLAEPWRIRLVP